MTASVGIFMRSIPIPNTEPGHYKLKVENGDESGWVTVDPASYQKYTVGQQYP